MEKFIQAVPGIILVLSFYSSILAIYPNSLDKKLNGMIKKGECLELIEVEIVQTYNRYFSIWILSIVFVFKIISFVYAGKVDFFENASDDVRNFSIALTAAFYVIVLLQIRIKLIKSNIKKYRKIYRGYQLSQVNSKTLQYV